MKHKHSPERILAARVRNGNTDRKRPRCPYPLTGRSTPEPGSYRPGEKLWAPEGPLEAAYFAGTDTAALCIRPTDTTTFTEPAVIPAGATAIMCVGSVLESVAGIPFTVTDA